MNTAVEQARDILRGNDLGGYTVPTKGLYPYQWNWDAAFTALGWATFDEPRAWRELECLFQGQWADGMLPHVVFHKVDPSYYPGPDQWGAGHAPPTSGITQPPVVATVVRLLLEGAQDRTLAEQKAGALYPRILAWHRWWFRARDPENTGLVVIYHPWESGMDNSPAWDEALARVPMTETEIQRRDTRLVDQSQRPHKAEYQRYMYLVELFRGLGWDPVKMYEKTPFMVADVAVNAILQRANLDLIELAGCFGTTEETDELQARVDHTRQAFASLWNPDRHLYQAWDRVDGKRIDVPTSAGLLPLFGRIPDPPIAGALAAELEFWEGQVRYLVPSVPPDHVRFERKRYWRGPVWLIVNFMIADGLNRYGFTELAERLRQHSKALIETGGFYEYYDPLDGKGLGGAAFSWTAAMALYWIGGFFENPPTVR